MPLINDKPNHKELCAKGGRSKSIKARESKSKNMSFSQYFCVTCKLKCPYKVANLDKDKKAVCTIKEDRWYAQQYGLKEIITTKVAEHKYYGIINEIENIIQINKTYMNKIIDEEGDIVPSKFMDDYTKQLAILSKIVLEVKIHFEKPEEVGFDNKDSILTDHKEFLNIVYKTITDSLDTKQADKIIGAIHNNVKGKIKGE